MSGVALLSWPFWRTATPGEWRVTMLDVGQGLAVVIERQGAAILYDTGPAGAIAASDSSCPVALAWSPS